MRTYIRQRVPGGTYFFTVNLAERRHNDLLIRYVDILREACRYVRQRHPFEISAMVILPEHLHCIWRLQEGDDDFPLRWRLLNTHFSRHIPKGENISRSRQLKG
jgi:putative transposase